MDSNTTKLHPEIMKGSASNFKRSMRKPPPPSSTNGGQSGSKNEFPPASVDNCELPKAKGASKGEPAKEDLDSKYVVVSSRTPSEVEDQDTKPGAFRVGGHSDIDQSSEGSSLAMVEPDVANSPGILPAELVHEDTHVVHERWRNLKETVGSFQDEDAREDGHRQKASKRMITLSVLCLLGTAIVAVVVGVTVGDKDSSTERTNPLTPMPPPLPTNETSEEPTHAPTESPSSQPLATTSPTSVTEQCTICYGGADPVDPNLEFYPGESLCGDSFPGRYFKDDYDCLAINAQAYWMCGCPKLPPPAENPLCSLCADGSFPTNKDTVIDYGEEFAYFVPYRNITCEAEATLLSYSAPEPGITIPFESCEGFQEAFGAICGCPDA